MNEVRKLYVDLAKGVALGAFGAVVFRDAPLLEKLVFTIIGAAGVALAHALVRRGELR